MNWDNLSYKFSSVPGLSPDHFKPDCNYCKYCYTVTLQRVGFHKDDFTLPERDLFFFSFFLICKCDSAFFLKLEHFFVVLFCVWYLNLGCLTWK